MDNVFPWNRLLLRQLVRAAERNTETAYETRARIRRLVLDFERDSDRLKGVVRELEHCAERVRVALAFVALCRRLMELKEMEDMLAGRERAVAELAGRSRHL